MSQQRLLNRRPSHRARQTSMRMLVARSTFAPQAAHRPPSALRPALPHLVVRHSLQHGGRGRCERCVGRGPSSCHRSDPLSFEASVVLFGEGGRVVRLSSPDSACQARQDQLRYERQRGEAALVPPRLEHRPRLQVGESNLRGSCYAEVRRAQEVRPHGLLPEVSRAWPALVKKGKQRRQCVEQATVTINRLRSAADQNLDTPLSLKDHASARRAQHLARARSAMSGKGPAKRGRILDLTA